MAETSVTDRTRQQGHRLRTLRERTGVSKGKLMDALGFETSRAYDLYEDGKTVIRLDRVEEWAQAFGLPVVEFTGYLLGQRALEETIPDTWAMADALRGHIPQTDIPGFVAEHEGKTLLEQKAAAEGIVDSANRARSRATNTQSNSRPA